MDSLSQDYKHFEKLIQTEDKIVFSFRCMVSNKSIIHAVSDAVMPDSQYVREYVSGGYIVNKMVFLEVFSYPLVSIDETYMSERLKYFIEQVWDAGGEFAGWKLEAQSSVDFWVQHDRDISASSAALE